MSNEVFYALSADKLIALCGYGEASDEGAYGMMAVINVIRNRAKDPGQFANPSILSQTGSVWHAVILAPNQFSPFNTGTSARTKMESMAASFDSLVNTNSALAQAYQLAQMLFMGTLEDNTSGATYFHATYVSPAWAQTIPFIGQIGTHLFYGYKTITTVIAENPVTTFVVTGIVAGGILYYAKRRG